MAEGAASVIFAKLDVCFWSHEKFVGVGPAASGYWVGVLAYLRDHETKDGVIPFHVTGMVLGVGASDADGFCKKLVEAGLFKIRKHGYELLGYALKNETKEQIEERRQDTLKRVHKHRLKPDCNSVTPRVTGQKKNAFVPGSDSDSLSALLSDQGETGAKVSEARLRAVTSAPESAPELSETGIRHRAPGGGHANRAHDGCSGIAVDAFEEGVKNATGRPLTKVASGALSHLLSAFDAHFPNLATRDRDVLMAAEAFARSEVTHTAFKFAEWLDRGRRTAREAIEGVPEYDSRPPIGQRESTRFGIVDSLTRKPVDDGLNGEPAAKFDELSEDQKATIWKLVNNR